ncbi:ligase [Bacteroidia bacterium]|nr:ligase [Bacteroidia bacterium]
MNYAAKYDKKPVEIYLVSTLSVLLFTYTFLPFRFWQTFSFSNQIEPLFIITTLSLACCICLLIVQIRKSNHSISITWLDIILFAYLLYLLLQLLFYSVDKEYIFQIICLTAVYCVFRQILSQLIIALFYLLPVLVVIQIIYGYNHLTEPWQGLSDSTGAFYNTGIFGGLVALGLVTGLGLILLTKPQKYYIDKIVLGIILVPVTIQLIYSQSRAGWLAAVAGTIVLLFPAFRKLTKLKAIVLVVILLIIGILFSAKLYHFKKDSADGRLLIWTISWNLFKEKPLAGFGPDGFQKNYMFRQGDYLKEHPDSPWVILAGNVENPFNELIKVSVEQGIIGLLLIISIILLTFTSYRNALFCSTFTVLTVFACFSYPFKFIVFQASLVICLAGIAVTQKPVVFFRQIRIKPAIAKVFVSLLIITGSFMLYSFCQYNNALKRWQKASIVLDDQTILELELLYPILKNNGLFISMYGSALYYNERYSESIPHLEEAMKLYPNTQILLQLGESYEKTGDHDKALKSWETASYMKPSLFAPVYNMAKLYFKQQDYVRATQKASEVLNKKIKIDNLKIYQMKQEMQIILNSDSIVN